MTFPNLPFNHWTARDATRASGPANDARFAHQIAETIAQALSAAGLDVQTDRSNAIRATIDGALSAAGLYRAPPAPSRHQGDVLDGVACDVDAEVCDIAPAVERAPARPADVAADEAGVRPGQFVTRSFSNPAGSLTYKLYVPSTYAAESTARVPMVVMLHGCTQSPDDFAAGTRMNALADQHGFLVVYPGQSAKANAMKCWNWFRADHQTRDAGEPSLIAGLAREVAATYLVDERRIFVAGMSAGGAMATVLGAIYPDLFAAVGCHSGLGYRAAHDLPSAVQAMGANPVAAMKSASRPGASNQERLAIPTIVFHGDQDHTVNPRNGAEVVKQVIAAHEAGAPPIVTTHESVCVDGRAASRTIYSTRDAAIAEHWIVHGAGHAWCGGSAAGSFTDERGPAASAEMLRFFFAHPRAVTPNGEPEAG